MTPRDPATRTESDSLGEIEVPADRYWGAQTQRSLLHFSIGEERIPDEVIRALALLKKAAARTNHELGPLPADKAELIEQACSEILEGRLEGNFPLHVWMTGSGTQSNMNVNEVVANRANELAGRGRGTNEPIHPNDHVNLSQSTNDVFPSAMHIAAVLSIETRLIPAVATLRTALHEKATGWREIVKIGRTHLQDAVPLTLGQEFSGYVSMLDAGLKRIDVARNGLYPLTIGGTAVGTGLNAPVGFSEGVVRKISDFTGLPFESVDNKFAAQGAHDAIVMASAMLKTLAVSLYKIANDIRLLGCGPRAGFHELDLPANEPGSSIMPGKVNPTQCEAMSMAALQVMGMDSAVAFAGAAGDLEMNVYKPLMIFNVIQSIRLLSDCCTHFSEFMVVGLEPNRARIEELVSRSLMLVTALSPVIGYDRASEIAHLARDKGLTLREAALELGYVSVAEFDRIVDPGKMTRTSD